MKNLSSSQFNYRLSIPEPENHLLEVELAIADWQGEFIDLKLPVWTPGSYLVREYAKHLQDFEATDAMGHPLSWQKISKNHWQVQCARNSDHSQDTTIKIRYRLFCNELTVRTNHIDRTHAFLTGAAVFMYVTEQQQQSYTVEIGAIKDNWQIATALPAVENATHTFYAKDFDTLVDSPFEIGMHQRYEFTVLDKPHSFVVWGQHNADMQRVVKDTAAIVAVEAEIFGGLPYDRYDFILHAGNGFGGLEHKNSTVLLYNRLSFRKEES